MAVALPALQVKLHHQSHRMPVALQPAEHQERHRKQEWQEEALPGHQNHQLVRQAHQKQEQQGAPYQSHHHQMQGGQQQGGQHQMQRALPLHQQEWQGLLHRMRKVPQLQREAWHQTLLQLAHRTQEHWRLPAYRTQERWNHRTQEHWRLPAYRTQERWKHQTQKAQQRALGLVLQQ
jgi:hypothetical protein